jgi:hypothetical protein
MVLYALGWHLEYVPGSENCGLALMTCDGSRDPGCGRYEV